MQHAATAFTIVPRHVLGGRAHAAPGEKINIAGVGIGGVGRSFRAGCAQEPAARIAFLCDMAPQYARPTFDEYPQAQRCRDYREMLDKEDKKIDAVLVATPDHTHAVVTMEALRRGKKLYWDAANLRFTNDDEANTYIKEPYRDGWKL